MKFCEVGDSQEAWYILVNTKLEAHLASESDLDAAYDREGDPWTQLSAGSIPASHQVWWATHEDFVDTPPQSEQLLQPRASRHARLAGSA